MLIYDYSIIIIIWTSHDAVIHNITLRYHAEVREAPSIVSYAHYSLASTAPGRLDALVCSVIMVPGWRPRRVRLVRSPAAAGALLIVTWRT